MSRFVLERLAKDRGYGSGPAVSIKNAKGGVVSIQWADGHSLVGEEKNSSQGEDAKVVQGEVIDG
jgi:hypothetical protein